MSDRNTKIALLQQEGWEIKGNRVFAYDRDFPIASPYAIHLKVYRESQDPEEKFQAMKAAFFALWPQYKLSWNYWMERMFREHCNPDSKIIVLAGGGGIGKTQACAFIAVLFWLANPTERAVITASTTLDSLRSRIFGYVERALKEMVIPFPFDKENSPPPKIHPPTKDYIHGIYAVAANRGDDQESIKNWIGRHPRDALLLILDEATDLPVAILSALGNLEKGLPGGLQTVAVGNSTSKYDLHGGLSTPKDGWDAIDPKVHFRWETTHAGGVCLYFNPYDSPAIHETDPTRKEALSRFLMTEEKLLEAEQTEGVDSETFWRFTMGFWKDTSTEKTIVSESFLSDYNCTAPAEFSGMVPLRVVAGLDPAFSSGGDKCILRLAVLGHHTNGKMVLDFRKESLVFDIKLKANTGKSIEIQIADAVIDICKQYKVPLNTLCVDASGQGRGLADVIALRSGTGLTPMKIYSTNVGSRKAQSAFDIVITSGYDMWFTGRQFITSSQIHGLDYMAYQQLHTRQFIVNKAGKKDLEHKHDYRKRMGSVSSILARSPDEADAAMLCLQSAIRHYGFHVGQEIENKKFQSLEHFEYFTAQKQRLDIIEQQKRNFKLTAGFSKGIHSVIGKKFI